ncbi:TerD family protein [Streptomyces sp. NPDC006798]|uniref:TerD family protein n=1 Tax=Streptomyces sp. NPDC006798 TaxID=3155462 RepID=UPI003406BBF0
MTYIPRGGDVPVPAVPLRVLVGHAHSPSVPGVEAAALLLDAGGRCRPGHQDMVCHGSTPHPSGTVGYAGRTDGHGQAAVWLDVNLPAVEPEIQRVVFLASVDGVDGLVFGMVPGLYVQAQGYDGALAARYEVQGATHERVFLLAEFYRRDGGWWFRATGQGYVHGLAGVLAELQGGPGIQAPEFQAPDRYAPGADVPPFVPENPNGTTGTMRAPVAGHSYAPGHRIVDPQPQYQHPPRPQPQFQPPPDPLDPLDPANPVPFRPPAPRYEAPPTFGAPAADPIPQFGIPAQIQQPQQPHPYASPAPAPAAPVPPAAPAAPAVDPFAEFPEFTPQLIRGKGGGVPSFHQPLPPGPVLLEMVFRDQDTDWPVVYQLNRRRETGNLLLSGEGDDFVARTPAVVPDDYPLSLEIISTAEWTITALPLSSARRLLPAVPLNGHTHDVLAYHGPDAELEVEYRGDPDRADASMSLTVLGPGELDMDDADFVQTDCLLVSAVGPFRQRVLLSGGTRLIHVDAKGAWTLTAHPL